MTAENVTRAVTRDEWKWVALVSAGILFVTIAPNLVAAVATPAGFHYSGFLYNWEESNPYLAKIVQGTHGDWLYTLSYTADPGQPFFLYFNYILLGHLAAILHIEPIVAFHVGRLFGGATLLASLYYFSARFFSTIQSRRVFFLLAALGSGFGWLLIGSGYVAADFWQTQIYPFLSILANVHFPVAMAALLWILDLVLPPADEPQSASLPARQWAILIGSTLIMATTQPYGLVIVAIMAALWTAICFARERRLPRATVARMATVSLIAAPFALYYRWLSVTNASYAGWDSQNLTPAAPIWDYALAGGLSLVLATIWIFVTLRRKPWMTFDNVDTFMLVSWIAISMGLVYLPLSQQRRFAFAVFIPLAILAVQALSISGRFKTTFYANIVVAMSTVTNILILLLACVALAVHVPYLYFTQAEWEALMYLRAQAPNASVVLASPDMGLYIPPWSGQRVIYGHPHETLDAKVRLDEVRRFYAGTLREETEFLRPISYIFFGPRERAIGAPAIPAPFVPVFNSGDVTIYGRP